MDIEEIEKLRVLLHSEDIENVRMGLELCEVLILDIEAVVEVFSLHGVSEPQSLLWCQKRHPHPRLLYGWALCKLLELECAWVVGLVELDLSACGLRAVPEVIQHHRILERLDLSFNALQTLPDLGALTRLRWLSILGNPLELTSVLPVLNDLGLSHERSLLSLSDVSGGRFMMGALPEDMEPYENEHPRHEVDISSDMLVMRTPVTQWLYAFVMGQNPSRIQGLNQPVERVSWYDAVRFANALSAFFGLPLAYEINGDEVFCDWDSAGWRLPTEAEWEYLARGGEVHLYAGSNYAWNVAWLQDNSGFTHHPVGQLDANAFGLYDMSGNVWEWCWDHMQYDEDWNLTEASLYSSAFVRDPRGASRGVKRVCRGGDWFRSARCARVSRRAGNFPDAFDERTGFRLIRTQE